MILWKLVLRLADKFRLLCGQWGAEFGRTLCNCHAIGVHAELAFEFTWSQIHKWSKSKRPGSGVGIEFLDSFQIFGKNTDPALLLLDACVGLVEIHFERFELFV
jgi:hypothetical protein